MGTEERRLTEHRARPKIVVRWGIPQLYRTASLDDNQTPAVRAVRRLLGIDPDPGREGREHTRCLVLAGPTGVGKSHAAIAGFFHLALWRTEYRSEYYDAFNLTQKFLDDDADRVLDRCINADWLVLEDLGLAYWKQGGLVEVFFEKLFVDREAEGRPMIVTTNFVEARFRDLVGDRVADRIAGPWGQWTSLEGRSLRRKSA